MSRPGGRRIGRRLPATGELLLEHDIVAWTDRVVFESDRCCRLVRARAGVNTQPVQHKLPMFAVDARTRKPFAPCNVSLSESHARALGWERAEVDLTFAWSDLQALDSKWFAVHLQPLGLDSGSPNAFYKLRQGKRTILIDAVSVLQLGVAPTQSCFDALMSPFRELAAWGAKRHRVHVISIWPEALGTSKNGLLGLSRTELRALASWLCCPQRLDALGEMAHNLLIGGRMVLPKISSTLRASCVGWQREGVFLVQTVNMQAGSTCWDIPGGVVVALHRLTGTARVVADTPYAPLDASYELFGEDLTVAAAFRGVRNAAAAEQVLENLINRNRRSEAFAVS